MSDYGTKKFERYSIHVNETPDRLTVNRPLQRIYEDIEKKMATSNLALPSATDILYGKAKFSSNDKFIFDKESLTPETSASYYNDMLTIGLVNEYAKSLTDYSSSVSFIAPSSESHSSVATNNYWVKNEYCDIDFSYMPNGVNCITGTMNLGFNDITAIFNGNDSVYSTDVLYPTSVSGYDTYINITAEDRSNVENYISYSSMEDKEDVRNLLKMNGVRMTTPFLNECKATMKHNICNWTTYSSFKQSFVELHYSTFIDTKGLYEKKFGMDGFGVVDGKGNASDSKYVDMRKREHPQIRFEQEPLVFMQVGFYSEDSEIKPLFGFDNSNSTATASASSDFKTYNRISLQPLTKSSESEYISPVNGFVMLKKFENEYDDSGLITNNIIHFDVVMKFMVGSAADPKMIYGLRTINSKAKLQFALIGV